MGTIATRTEPLAERRRGFLLANLTIGHGIAHFYQQSFLVLLPKMVSDLGISGLGVGALGTVRQLTSFAVEVPGGFVVDSLRRQWGLILAGCIGLIAVAWAVVGVTPNLPFLVIAVVFIAFPGTLWHLPAIAALSQRFPERKGMAMSVHGLGGNAGNIVGPLVAGVLMGVFLLSWRQVAFVYAVPPLVLAALFWASLRGIRGQGPREDKGLMVRLGDARRMAGDPSIRGLVAVAMLRAMGFETITLFTPVYLANELNMGDTAVGFHVMLLTALGIVALPLMGVISDSLGRKAVLFPGFGAMALLAFALVNAGSGIYLTLVIAAMGLFSYSLNQVLRAAALDLAPQGTEATSYGLIFGSTQVVAAFSPIVAGALEDRWGFEAVFYYAAIVVALAAFVIFASPLRPMESPERGQNGTHG
jgi:MFS family permease